MEKELNRWWNDNVVPTLNAKVAELIASGRTKRDANDLIVAVMLRAVRQRHQKFFDQIRQKG
jgi:hypothetical protein